MNYAAKKCADNVLAREARLREALKWYAEMAPQNVLEWMCAHPHPTSVAQGEQVIMYKQGTEQATFWDEDQGKIAQAALGEASHAS